MTDFLTFAADNARREFPVETYEDKQVRRACDDATRKYNGDTLTAAASYGEDVKKMLGHKPEYWDALGMIRLYTRIAVRLATGHDPAYAAYLTSPIDPRD